ncbi:hypothetical protein CUMW_070000 [Citrus unshiu]|nr:hypothetical protein CUMW_070000 [Citrus unshiu]
MIGERVSGRRSISISSPPTGTRSINYKILKIWLSILKIHDDHPRKRIQKVIMLSPRLRQLRLTDMGSQKREDSLIGSSCSSPVMR